MEALDTAAEAYEELRAALEDYSDELDELGVSDPGPFAAPEALSVIEGAILDFREAIGDPDPDAEAAKIGRAFLQECEDRCIRRAADADAEGAGARGLMRDGFRALVRRFLP